MQAIVNVSKFNQYSKFNGHTFDVVEILSTVICLNINGTRMDFSHTEVILVNLQEIIRDCVIDVTRSSKPEEYILRTNIERYIKHNNISTQFIKA